MEKLQNHIDTPIATTHQQRSVLEYSFTWMNIFFLLDRYCEYYPNYGKYKTKLKKKLTSVDYVRQNTAHHGLLSLNKIPSKDFLQPIEIFH